MQLYRVVSDVMFIKYYSFAFNKAISLLLNLRISPVRILCSVSGVQYIFSRSLALVIAV